MKKGLVDMARLILMLIITFIVAIVIFSFIDSVTANIVTPSGPVPFGEVICFGEGEEDRINCLNKLDGTSVWTLTSARAWRDRNDCDFCREGFSKPAIEDDVIYTGLGNHICAYASSGGSVWGDCTEVSSSVPLTSKIELSTNYACLIEKELLNCYDKEQGFLGFSFESETDMLDFEVEEDSVYFSTGGLLCEYEMPDLIVRQSFLCNANDCPDADCKKTSFPKVIDIAVGQDNVCFVGSSAGFFTPAAEYQLSCVPKNNLQAVITGAITERERIFLSEFVNNNLYFSSGSEIGKTSVLDIGSNVALKKSAGSKITSPIISDGKLVCFGGNRFFKCLDSINFNNRLTINAGPWDDTKSFTSSIIEDDRIYFGLGDKICAYNKTTTGTYDCVLDDPFCEAAEWCADFTIQLIAGLSIEESNE